MIAVADEFDALSEHAQAIYDAWDENNAGGVQLDNICAISPGISRKAATKSQVTLTLVGDASTIIPIGSSVETDAGILFLTTETVEIPAAGSITVVAEASVAGAVVVLAGQITSIVTPVGGWDSVTNVLAASPGTDDETDPDLRLRRRLSMQVAGGRASGALLANIIALPFITDGYVAENDQAVERLVDGVLLPANSLLSVVTPNPLTSDQADTLAQVIYGLIPMGIQSFGAESATVLGADGTSKSVGFSYPLAFNVSTQITFSIRPGFSSSAVQTEIETVRDTYFAGLGPADEVNRLDLAALVAANVPGAKSFVVLLQGVALDVQPAATQVATWTATGSTVTEI